MAIFDILKRQETVSGGIVRRGLPPHKMFSVIVTSLVFPLGMLL
jgi:hypothetical protein